MINQGKSSGHQISNSLTVLPKLIELETLEIHDLLEAVTHLSVEELGVQRMSCNTSFVLFSSAYCQTHLGQKILYAAPEDELRYHLGLEDRFMSVILLGTWIHRQCSSWSFDFTSGASSQKIRK
uniref:Uncharacterized protein n=1 Tax=Nelumbo nucifera TaxID=4432 RepID=A0A822ZPY1_NELNU|nr:TPA_asm: hypothetical protein HUJ06_003639 [Nelumbo nucifera]